jgi:hypothetical protein
MSKSKKIIPESKAIIDRWSELRKLQAEFDSSVEQLEASIRARRARMRKEDRKDEGEAVDDEYR